MEAESKPASSAGDVLTAPVEKPTILVDSQKPGGSREEKEEADKQTKEKENETDKAEQKAKPKKKPKRAPVKKGEAQSFISVNIKKMDLLMDLIGELVIAEAVVLQNPDLKVPGLDLTNFQKSAGQLSKITSELQDAIMAMRMMPLKNTFQKMNRIVYDTSKKLGKDIELEVIGEDTEVDKNITNIFQILSCILYEILLTMELRVTRTEKPSERRKRERLCSKPKMRAVRYGYRYQTTVRVLKRMKSLKRQRQMDSWETEQKKTLPKKKYSIS